MSGGSQGCEAEGAEHPGAREPARPGTNHARAKQVAAWETAFMSLTAAGKDEQKMRTEGHKKVVRDPSVSSVRGLPANPCLCRDWKLIQA